MKVNPPIATVLSGLAAVLFVGWALAADWDACQDDLDRLRRAARDAADIAETVKSRADDVEDAKNALRSCGTWSRDCSAERWRYESASSDFESAKGDLESELGTVASRIRSVEASCGYPVGSGRFATPPRSPDSFCAVLRRYKGSLPDQALIDVCKRSRSEEECRRCLE